MCCHALLQGVFQTQGLNPHLLCLLHWQSVLYHLNHLGSPWKGTLRLFNPNSSLRRRLEVIWAALYSLWVTDWGANALPLTPAFYELSPYCCCLVAVSYSLWAHGLQLARLPVFHYLPEFPQTHVHWVNDTIHFLTVEQCFQLSKVHWPIWMYWLALDLLKDLHFMEMLVFLKTKKPKNKWTNQHGTCLMLAGVKIWIQILWFTKWCLQNAMSGKKYDWIHMLSSKFLSHYSFCLLQLFLAGEKMQKMQTKG